MARKKFHRGLEVALLALILFLFCYFRLKPIYLQTVPYTFDQGRDFLKVAEMVIGGNLTFIGPTTGLGGMFHGPWWYYFLTIPFLASSGAPVVFYYGIFSLSLISNLLFYFFLRREFGVVAGLLFMSIVAASPYFIKTSIFAINSVLTLPFILLLFYSIFQHFKTKGKVLCTFLAFLSMGFITEAELAFGFLIYPAFLLTLLITKQLRQSLGTKRKFLAAFAGALIPMIPRVLFELKNGFMQSKALLNFLQNPTETNPNTLKGVIVERYNLFRGFYEGLFMNVDEVFLIGVFSVAIVALIYSLGRMKNYHKRSIVFISVFGVMLYLVSLTNKNNFFWDYYLEGFPYFYVFLISVGMGYLYLKGPSVLKLVSVIVLFLLVGQGTYNAYADFSVKKEPRPEGLRVHMQIVDYIYSQVGDEDFCLQIYTPPVFAHTYNYIINYYVNTSEKKRPSDIFYKNKCWYIIEKDDYIERQADWIARRIPQAAEKVKEKKFGENVTIELWKEE